MARRFCVCFYFQTPELMLVGLQLPDTGKRPGRGRVESLHLRLTSSAGLSKPSPSVSALCCSKGERALLPNIVCGIK